MSAISKATLGALCAATLLAACSSGEPEDVRQWMKESSKDMRGKVPDLPQLKLLPILAYEPGDLASPFVPEKLFADDAIAKKAAQENTPNAVNPDAYPLTRVPIESIRLLGTLMIGKQLTALVTAERDVPRRVRVGDYLGQNQGRITSITPSNSQGDGTVTVVEKIFDKGAWVERETKISQPGQGDKK